MESTPGREDESERDCWIAGEVDREAFADARHGRRLERLLAQVTGADAGSMPWACEDWAAAKAAYRYFDNERITEGMILEGHFAATARRAARQEGMVLVVHDTTQLSFKRDNPRASGETVWETCGVLMHSSLVVSTSGTPLGLAAARYWTRGECAGANALARGDAATRLKAEGKESARWVQNLREATRRLGAPSACVHICDRESDIYEFFLAARDAGTHFLVRTCTERLTQGGVFTIPQALERLPAAGCTTVETTGVAGKPIKAHLSLSFGQFTVLPPCHLLGKAAPMVVWVIHAREIDPPAGREALEWRLITDVPVETLEDAVRMLRWYALRWRIETFHKTLKSNCRIEDSGLQTAERLTRLAAVCCVASWRMFWLTTLSVREVVTQRTLNFK
jgi:hypothetical protein